MFQVYFYLLGWLLCVPSASSPALWPWLQSLLDDEEPPDPLVGAQTSQYCTAWISLDQFGGGFIGYPPNPGWLLVHRNSILCGYLCISLWLWYITWCIAATDITHWPRLDVYIYIYILLGFRSCDLHGSMSWIHGDSWMSRWMIMDSFWALPNFQSSPVWPLALSPAN